MSILINSETNVIVQGITGRAAEYFSRRMLQYGTNIIAGVSPTAEVTETAWAVDGRVPVFSSIAAAKDLFPSIKASILFVPKPAALDALYEAADAGISLIVCVTKGIPLQDITKACRYMDNRGIRFIGPNTPGIFNPGESMLGVYPTDCAIQGDVGVISRSGTLSYLVLETLKNAGIGVSTCIGIGGDSLQGTTLVDALRLMEADSCTKKIIIIGEVGGLEEERAAKQVVFSMTKPVISFLAGRTLPEERYFGHSGAYIDAGIGGIEAKEVAFRQAGIRVIHRIADIPAAIRKISSEQL